MTSQRTQVLVIATAILVMLLTLSGISPFDRTTWLLEVLPILLAMPVLWTSYRHFPLTNLLYVLIFCHCVVLMVGGAYSYARVPLGFQIQELLHLSRNPYDKLGHFFQGFVPSLIAREILIRGRHVKAGRMLAFLVVCVALAISAAYELVEWATAIWLGQGADEFLGSQGDPWDTQSDMFCAFIGSITALLGLSGIQDRQILQISRQQDPKTRPRRTHQR